jgi:hypothetical protein
MDINPMKHILIPRNECYAGWLNSYVAHRMAAKCYFIIEHSRALWAKINVTINWKWY